jgi:hypothetical protein
MESLYPRVRGWDVELAVTTMEETLNRWNAPMPSRPDGGDRHEIASDDAGHEQVQALMQGDEAGALVEPDTSHAAAAQSSARGNSAATPDAESREAGARDPSQRSPATDWYADMKATGKIETFTTKHGNVLIRMKDDAAASKQSPSGAKP